MGTVFDNIGAREIGVALLDLAMPRWCVVCGGRLMLRERFICLECLADLPLTYYWSLSHNPMADKFNARIQADLDQAFLAGQGRANQVLVGQDHANLAPADQGHANQGPAGKDHANLALVGQDHANQVPEDQGHANQSLAGQGRANQVPEDQDHANLALAGQDQSCQACPDRRSLASSVRAVLPGLPGQPAGPLEPYAYAVALFFYNSESGYKKICQHLKYHAGIASGRYFATKLGRFMARSELYRDVDLVIPVPLHWTRRRARGYNQAEVIARELAAALGASLRTDVLVRARRTRTQTRMSVSSKSDNVSGAFSVRKHCPEARHVLLVDDTFTTGSTLDACRCALRAVLPASVRISVATLAFVVV